MKGTRERVLAEALQLFRRRGFDRTTMRDVAGAAELSLGAAYYYFASKDAIVLAYYEAQQDAHARLSRARLTESATLRARLGAVVHAKLDVLSRDRKLLATLFRSVGDPADPAGPFGAATRHIREGSVALFAEAIAAEPLDDETKEVAATALWALHLGLLLYYLHDASPKQAKTRRLVDGALDLVAEAIPLGPLIAPITRRLTALLRESGVVGEAR